MESNSSNVRFDPEIGSDGAVVVRDLTITEGSVVQEARHWTNGHRGEACDTPEGLAGADLTTFVREAVALGARALGVTAQTSEARAVEQMLREVGQKTNQATINAATATQLAVANAANTVVKAATDAKKAIVEADEHSRKELTAAVDAAKRDLSGEVRRVFGGESPELIERLQPLLDYFGSSLEAKAQTNTGLLLEKVARQFDPADPTSPLAKHTETLKAQQQTLATQIEKNHIELTGKVEELTTTLKVNEARTSLAKVTPIKGGSFEDQIHALMRSIAGGLGDEYVDTTSTVGRIPRSKKGDGVLGVLGVAGGATRVVVEMTDSARSGWGDYFDEAERNREATAALGLVRTSDQNGGQALRVLGSRRVVMAFDPDSEDPELLRTVVMLLRTVAIAASARNGATEIATAEEKSPTLSSRSRRSTRLRPLPTRSRSTRPRSTRRARTSAPRSSACWTRHSPRWAGRQVKPAGSRQARHECSGRKWGRMLTSGGATREGAVRGKIFLVSSFHPRGEAMMY